MRGQIGAAPARGGRPGGGRPGSGRPSGDPPAADRPNAVETGASGGRPSGAPTETGGPPTSGGPPSSGAASSGAPSSGAPSPGGPPAAARGGPDPAAFLGRGGPQRPRYFFNLSHTVELEDTILVAAGVPLLDQLDGDATSTFGLARHSTRLEAGLFFGGAGVRVSGRYLGKAEINGTGLPGSSDLFVDDLATIDLRVFADLGRLLNKEDGPLKGLRLSFRADNIFDGRRIVRDDSGAIPLRFQPLLVDPTGRFLGIDIRKLF